MNWLRLRWAFGLTKQCWALEPGEQGMARSYCQRREGHPGAHISDGCSWSECPSKNENEERQA